MLNIINSYNKKERFEYNIYSVLHGDLRQKNNVNQLDRKTQREFRSCAQETETQNLQHLTRETYL